MNSLLPIALGAAASDILTGYGSSFATLGGAGLTAMVGRLLRKRLETAQEILLDELRRGKRSLAAVEEVDELAAIVFRYGRAAQEGTAKLNLRLMAKVIAGQAHLGSLVADEFLAWADVLASLRREEVILLACFLKENDRFLHEADGKVSLSQLWDRCRGQVVPTVFSSEDRMRVSACAVMRTGLLMNDPTFDGTGFFAVSPLLKDLVQVASFQDALREEGIDLGEDCGCP